MFDFLNNCLGKKRNNMVEVVAKENGVTWMMVQCLDSCEFNVFA